MLLRFVTTLGLLAVLGVVGFFLDTMLLNVFILLVSALGVFEVMRATGLSARRDLTLLALTGAMVIPLVGFSALATPMIYLIVFSYFLLLVKKYGKLRLIDCAMALLFGTVIPLSFACAIFLRDTHGAQAGGFYILLALTAAWASDTGAYFAGRFLGKHKLAPVVSPKKTIEGAVGGVAVCTGMMIWIGVGYQNMFGGQVNMIELAIIAPILSVIGMFGDLSASAIKREYGVKDFGNIMPGHGGVLDRFDSVLFTLPAVYLISTHLPLIVT
ncbi:MAG: phosphatidate cytidylyltransferase [Oscillospiraceae bacterium]|nr:phosphatidate cytidylyltransferase [Oscillospiraceae bacterium]